MEKKAKSLQKLCGNVNNVCCANNELQKLALKASRLNLLDQLVVLKVQQDLPYKVLAAVHPALWEVTLDAVEA